MKINCNYYRRCSNCYAVFSPKKDPICPVCSTPFDDEKNTFIVKVKSRGTKCISRNFQGFKDVEECINNIHLPGGFDHFASMTKRRKDFESIKNKVDMENDVRHMNSYFRCKCGKWLNVETPWEICPNCESIADKKNGMFTIKVKNYNDGSASRNCVGYETLQNLMVLSKSPGGFTAIKNFSPSNKSIVDEENIDTVGLIEDETYNGRTRSHIKEMLNSIVPEILPDAEKLPVNCETSENISDMFSVEDLFLAIRKGYINSFKLNYPHCPILFDLDSIKLAVIKIRKEKKEEEEKIYAVKPEEKIEGPLDPILNQILENQRMLLTNQDKINCDHEKMSQNINRLLKDINRLLKEWNVEVND